MLKNIFPLQIYEVDFPNYDLIKDNLLSDIMTLFNKNLELYSKHRLFNQSYSLEGTEDGMYRDLHLRLEYPELMSWIQEQVINYWRAMQYSRFVTPEIVHMWSNLTPKGGNIIQHNHSPFEIAGSFYVDASPDQGCLVLVDPNELIRGRLPYYDSQESKQGRFFFDHVVEPRPGKLVLFPGWLYHKTQKNPSKSVDSVNNIRHTGLCDHAGTYIRGVSTPTLL
jgi:uncharacterized protein (TIGR02466 family)